MPLTAEQERLDAAVSLVDDHEILAAETRARISWLNRSITSTQRRIEDADSSDEDAALTFALSELFEFRGLLEQRLSIYDYYRRILKQRRLEWMQDQ